MTSLTKRATPIVDAQSWVTSVGPDDRATVVYASDARSLEQRLGAAVAALELMLEMSDNDDRSYDVRPVFARETLAAIKEAK